MAPKWDPHNLKRHHRKRTTKDAGCFEDLLRLNGRMMTELEYEERSEAAVADSWAQYQGKGRNVTTGDYYPPTMYFVDEELVVAITDLSESEFVTCFHEHFSRRHVAVATMPSVGQRKLRCKEHLQFDEQGKLILNVKWIRDV